MLRIIDIKNFKTIKNTTLKLDFYDNVTTIIGENESGKTNLLQAIEFNTTKEKKVEQDFKFNYNVNNKFVKKVWFEISENQKEVLMHHFSYIKDLNYEKILFGIEFSEKDEKLVQNQLSFDDFVFISDNNEFEKLKNNFSEFQKKIESNYKIFTEKLVNDAQLFLREYELGKVVFNLFRPENYFTHYVRTAGFSDIKEIFIRIIRENPQMNKELISKFENDIEILNEIINFKNFHSSFSKLIKPIKAEYFLGFQTFLDYEYDLKHWSSHKTLISFFNLKELNLKDEMLKINSSNTLANRKNLEKELELNLNEFLDFCQSEWLKNNDIKIKLNVEENKIYVTVKDKNKDYESIKNRGMGFQAYVGFLLIFHKFIANLDKKNINILLLDEPDTYFHPGLQNNLLKYIKIKAEEHNFQVIISTHSPYLIDDIFYSTKIVTRNIENNTVVYNNLANANIGLENNRFWYAPIATALGTYYLDFTLSLHKTILLIEGLSDYCYIKFFLKKINYENKFESIKLGYLKGAPNVEVLETIHKFGIRHLFLLDNDQGAKDNKKIIEKKFLQYYENKNLEDLRLTHSHILGNDFIDIESLFSEDDRKTLKICSKKDNDSFCDFYKNNKILKSHQLNINWKKIDISQETKVNIEKFLQHLIEKVNKENKKIYS